MITQTADIIRVLKKINVDLDIELLSPEDIARGNSLVENLKCNKKKLQATIQRALHEKLDSEHIISAILADLSKYLGNIIQCLDGIFDLLILSIQRRRKYFDLLESQENIIS